MPADGSIVPPMYTDFFWEARATTKSPTTSAKANKILDDAGYKKGADGSVRCPTARQAGVALQHPHRHPVEDKLAQFLDRLVQGDRHHADHQEARLQQVHRGDRRHRPVRHRDQRLVGQPRPGGGPGDPPVQPQAHRRPARAAAPSRSTATTTSRSSTRSSSRSSTGPSAPTSSSRCRSGSTPTPRSSPSTTRTTLRATARTGSPPSPRSRRTRASCTAAAASGRSTPLDAVERPAAAVRPRAAPNTGLIVGVVGGVVVLGVGGFFLSRRRKTMADDRE